MCRGAMDRVYFTMFYCACAMLATKEFGPSRDGNVATKFYREFVKTGMIPGEFGERFKHATQLHQDTDHRFARTARLRPAKRIAGRCREFFNDNEAVLGETIAVDVSSMVVLTGA
jgi:uncharacterized protein (UPF0332 family)